MPPNTLYRLDGKGNELGVEASTKSSSGAECAADPNDKEESPAMDSGRQQISEVPAAVTGTLTEEREIRVESFDAV